MALRTYGDFQRAVAEGRHWSFWYRRNAPASNAGGQWADLSFTSGNPRINAYAGSALESTRLNGSYGFWHGPDVASRGYEKYLYSLSVLGTGSASFPGEFMLLDYLLFYPLIDLSDPSEQTFANVLTLPRYADGAGVRAMLVLTLSAGTAAADVVTISYTNQDGVAGRVGTATLNPAPAVPAAGFVINGHGASTPAVNGPGHGPFFSLEGTDYGVRSVESIACTSASFGGFASLVLVRPLTSFRAGEATSPRRADFLFETPPTRIYDGAYLNLLTMPNAGSASSIFMGDLQIAWG